MNAQAWIIGGFVLILLLGIALGVLIQRVRYTGDNKTVKLKRPVSPPEEAE